MKKLIAIMTCRKRGYTAKATAQRDTWVPQVRADGADVFFFVGRGVTLADGGYSDEVVLDVPDDYSGIPLKVKGICAWAAERNYDFVSKVDDDVYVVPSRYAALSLSGCDYVGRFRGPCGDYPAHFASGFFYTLSHRAAQIVATTPWNQDWMDERFVACSLAARGIFGHTDPASYLVTGPFHKPADLLRQAPALRYGIAYCQYGPDDMHAMHGCFKDAPAVFPLQPLIPAARMMVTQAQLLKPPTDRIPLEKMNRG